MSVRAATIDDVPEIAALELEAFPDDAWPADYLAAAAAGKVATTHLLVAERDGWDERDQRDRRDQRDQRDQRGEVVGHAILSLVFEIAELQRIAVAEPLRRSGIGRALLDAVVASATEAGAERLLLEVREHNGPALAFYRRAGFVEIDRRERYYRDGSTAIVLQLPLDRPS